MQNPAPTLPSAPDAPVAPAPPQAPAVPAVADGPATPGVAGVPVTARTVPRTAADLAALKQQREWLSDQLVSAQGRREEVARALEKSHDPVNQNGLQQRLQVLDRRILQLETDMAETGRLMTSAPASAVAVQASRLPTVDFDRGPSASVVAIVFILSVLLPLAVTLGRILVRRTQAGAPAPADRETASRLARIEQSVDAIAVEVERVSEGQRFVTRLLADERVPGATRQLADQGAPR